MLVSQPGAKYQRWGQGREDVGMGQTMARNDGPLTQASSEWHEPSPMSLEALEPGILAPERELERSCLPLATTMSLETQLPPFLLSHPPQPHFVA